ncbi:MAG: hypothetical protein EZS28_016383 [Streblomastix strix]|uniref:Uncharacterized protein n=1 Tax=Streblomastix strix TaxID=222440 RepID=A0A5J4VZU7_9EUKA|nr:MAG: hypothetical protein EZS28_016383 [Streblomastix strix]
MPARLLQPIVQSESHPKRHLLQYLVSHHHNSILAKQYLFLSQTRFNFLLRGVFFRLIELFCDLAVGSLVLRHFCDKLLFQGSCSWRIRWFFPMRLCIQRRNRIFYIYFALLFSHMLLYIVAIVTPSFMPW